MNRKRKIFRICILFFLLVHLTTNVTASTSCSTATLQSDTSIVELYGQLRVEGNRIVSAGGDTVAIRGMSLFWSQWIGKYYNYDCIQWLRDDWKCTVVRAALAVESGGYLENPETEMAKVRTVIDACIDLGIYVIIDWHDHHAQRHEAESIEFFTELADEYGDLPNIIYEIYNEPQYVTWADSIKPYAEAVISEIRAIDPDNIIVVGTPTWSQDVDVAANNPIDDENVVYALHFYAATHKQWLRNKAITAMNKGIALWVTEFGTCESSGSGVLDYTETENWFNFMDQHMISWCNWSIADKDETSAALVSGASPTGGWSDSDISESGSLIRDEIIAWYEQGYRPVSSLERSEQYVLKTGFNLNQNYPNPFNASTNIRFSLSSAQQVTIDIYNILGEKIITLLDKKMNPGTYNIPFHSGNLPSGIYFYQCQAKNNFQSGRMLLIK
jgi:endoglucanase